MEDCFCLVGLCWVFPKTVKEILLSWRGSFVERKRKKFLKSIPICTFWEVLKERNRTTFKVGTLVVQCLKHSFVYNLWSGNKLYLVEGVTTLLGYLEWLPLSEVVRLFCYVCFLLLSCLYMPKELR